MTITSKIAVISMNKVSIQAHEHRIRDSALKVVRFILHLLEMVVAMMVGMVILYMLDEQVLASTPYSGAIEYGTIRFDFVMTVFMTVPMAAWMIVRRHDRQHVVEMSIGMNALVAVIIVLRLLGADADLPWLVDASHPAMFLGMIIAMLYRHDHYTGRADHSAHAAHREMR